MGRIRCIQTDAADPARARWSVAIRKRTSLHLESDSHCFDAFCRSARARGSGDAPSRGQCAGLRGPAVARRTVRNRRSLPAPAESGQPFRRPPRLFGARIDLHHPRRLPAALRHDLMRRRAGRGHALRHAHPSRMAAETRPQARARAADAARNRRRRRPEDRSRTSQAHNLAEEFAIDNPSV